MTTNTTRIPFAEHARTDQNPYTGRSIAELEKLLGYNLRNEDALLALAQSLVKRHDRTYALLWLGNSPLNKLESVQNLIRDINEGIKVHNDDLISIQPPTGKYKTSHSGSWRSLKLKPEDP